MREKVTGIVSEDVGEAVSATVADGVLNCEGDADGVPAVALRLGVSVCDCEGVPESDVDSLSVADKL